MTLPADVERCAGSWTIYKDGTGRWRKGCMSCQRRLAPVPVHWMSVPWIKPPPLVDGKRPMRIAEGQS